MSETTRKYAVRRSDPSVWVRTMTAGGTPTSFTDSLGEAALFDTLEEAVRTLHIAMATGEPGPRIHIIIVGGISDRGAI